MTTETGPEVRADWTIDPATNRSNSSPRFRELVDEVARLIREGAAGSVLSPNWVYGKAGLITAQLAHVQGLAPAGWTPSLYEAAYAIDLELRILAGAHAAVLPQETRATLARLRETIGTVLDEAPLDSTEEKP